MPNDSPAELPPVDRGWAVYQSDDVVVSICPDEGVDPGGCTRAVWDRFESLVCQSVATAHVSILEITDFDQPDLFDRLQQVADVMIDCGIERWAIVADPTIQYALVDTLSSVPVDLYTTSHRGEAMAWARGTRPSEDELLA